MEWLEVRIVVPSERLVEQRCIKTLDCDRQPLDNERPFSVVTRHFTYMYLIRPKSHDYAGCHLQPACRVLDQHSSPTLDLLVWVYHYHYLFDADYRPVA